MRESSNNKNTIVDKIFKEMKNLRFKSFHRAYINDEISYGDFYNGMFHAVNKVRNRLGVPSYSLKKYDEGWQYRNVGAEDWKTAREEIMNLIFGWW
jgi:hypothetical protein